MNSGSASRTMKELALDAVDTLETCNTRHGESRVRPAGETMEESIALTLDPYTADQTTAPTVQEIAEGADGITVECLSTRCATVEPNECVKLYCRRDWRFMQPDVVQCKLRKTIKCQE